MKSLGDHHSSLAFALVKDLLNTHPYFVSQEPDADDPACMKKHVYIYIIHRSILISRYWDFDFGFFRHEAFAADGGILPAAHDPALFLPSR